MVHLCLYNLSVIHKKKYFDFDMELMAYIIENWEVLQLGEVRALQSTITHKIPIFPIMFFGFLAFNI